MKHTKRGKQHGRAQTHTRTRGCCCNRFSRIYIFRQFVSNPENAYPLCCFKIFKHLSSHTMLCTSSSSSSIFLFCVMLYHFMLGLFVYLGSSLIRYVCMHEVYVYRLVFSLSISLPSILWYFGYILLFAISFQCACVFAKVSDRARVATIALPIAICDSESCFRTFMSLCTHSIYIYVCAVHVLVQFFVRSFVPFVRFYPYHLNILYEFKWIEMGRLLYRNRKCSCITIFVGYFGYIYSMTLFLCSILFHDKPRGSFF